MNKQNAVHLITSSERETQDLLIEKLIYAIPEFTYIGKLEDDFYTNIREKILTKYMVEECGHSKTDAANAIRELRTTVGLCTNYGNLCDVSEKVYSLLRYGAKVPQQGGTTKDVHVID